MKLTVKTEGFKQLEGRLAMISANVTRRNVGIRALTKGAVPMRDAIKRLAPEDEGDLKESIQISDRAHKGGGRKTKRGGSGGQFGDIVEVFIGIDPTPDPRLPIYSVIAEEGEQGRPAKPYMRPGYEAEKYRALDHIKEALTDEIDKNARRARK